MIKIVDMNGLFDSFVKNYIAEKGAPKKGADPDEILIELYKAFEEKRFDELGGKTPAEYYLEGVDNYGALLKKYFDEGLELNDYLIDACVEKGKEEDFLFLIDGSLDEDIVIPAVDIFDKKNSKLPFNRYIDLLFDENTDGCIVDRIAEVLSDNADEVADKILERLKTYRSENTVFAEILSNCVIRRDGIKEILLHGLKLGDRVPEFCSYIVKYGDESMVDELIKFGEEIEGYVDFKEINIAIEALGGVSLTDREFSEDADYIVMNVTLDKGNANGGKNKRK